MPSREQENIERVRNSLRTRSIVLVGLMGCGKSALGRRLAAKLGLPFVDADEEIEHVAQKSISEIFADHGENFFRDREMRVIARLLKGGPQVLATGGGAYMMAETRENIAKVGISVWLKADLQLLMRRVAKRDKRPLLQNKDPEAVMRDLMVKRHPVYGEANLIIQSRDVSHDVMVGEVLNALANYEGLAEPPAI